MAGRKVTRWQASGVHLAISVAIALSVLTVMLVVWYPWPLFQTMGGAGLLLILCGVDVVIGPLLTLIVFRQGKPGLKLDLAAIALVQVAALAYGSHVVFLARPAFIVFVKDQFQVAIAADMDPARLAKAKYLQFREVPVSGPLLAVADMPSDPAERNKLVEAALAGIDLEQFPETFVPYSQRTAKVLEIAQPIARIRRSEPQTGRIIDEWLAGSGRSESEVRYLPLRARRGWVAVLVDARTAAPVKMLVVEKF